MRECGVLTQNGPAPYSRHDGKQRALNTLLKWTVLLIGLVIVLVSVGGCEEPVRTPEARTPDPPERPAKPDPDPPEQPPEPDPAVAKRPDCYPNPNCAGADLEGTDLAGADLADADLSDANLRRASLTGTNLRRASLDMADLSGAERALRAKPSTKSTPCRSHQAMISSRQNP